MLASNSSKYKTPLILDKVASLTKIRDLDIFEFSFMKSLARMLRVRDISLYKFNNANQAYRLIKYSSDTEISDNKKIEGEVREVYIENIDIPPILTNAIDWIESTGKIYTSKVDGEYHGIYPVLSLDRVIGYLSVTLSHELSDSDNLVITSLLSISENFNSLLEENQKDKLTGLLNRKTFDENISKIQELTTFSGNQNAFVGDDQRVKTSSNRYWLSIIDIDRFKRINDNFGHVYGDEVLLTLSQIMKKTFRPSDLLFRFGGEEFIVIVKSETPMDTRNIFERFRQTMEDFTFPQVGQVTISLGVTEIHGQNYIASDIVGKADQALYHAKENGRNKLFFYEDLIDEGILQEKIEGGDIELF